MKLPEDIRLDIQYFSYFLFKGSLDPRLISAEYDYLDKLLADSTLLYNCFKAFTYALINNEKPSALVSDYIIGLHDNEATAKVLIEKVEQGLNDCGKLWKDFLVLSQWFCFNSFPDPVKYNYFLELHGCGADGVPVFAVWTNVVEVDENLNVLNSGYALKRANERIKMWDGQLPSKPFEGWELEQELY